MEEILICLKEIMPQTTQEFQTVLLRQDLRGRLCRWVTEQGSQQKEAMVDSYKRQNQCAV